MREGAPAEAASAARAPASQCGACHACATETASAKCSAAAARRPRFAYFPFGGGSRRCIGGAFATTEAVLLLATIAGHFRLTLAPGHPVALWPTITLRPKHGMRMLLHHRSQPGS